MLKEYVILYTNNAVVVPIKASLYPRSTTPSYQATFPQFFGGTVDQGNTLENEVTQESQGLLELPDTKTLLISGTVGDDTYHFYRAELAHMPALGAFRTEDLPNNQLEMQDLLVLSKSSFEGTFTIPKLIQLCQAINPAYCNRASCTVRNRCKWDDWGTKDAFTAFFAVW